MKVDGHSGFCEILGTTEGEDCPLCAEHPELKYLFLPEILKERSWRESDEDT